jgi:N6-L-threonylcarbamoyladenine synthase
MLDRPDLDFSFSGLKTAVAMAAAALGPPPHPPEAIADIAASFQAAVIDTLVAKTARALDRTAARALNLGGGVACNGVLRARMQAECEARGVAIRVPTPRLCADNAAMVALVGAWMLDRGDPSDPELDAMASLEESGLDLGK